MSDNNSDDEALKEIDSEGESTEAVSGQPEVESDVQDKADSSDESHEEARRTRRLPSWLKMSLWTPRRRQIR